MSAAVFISYSRKDYYFAESLAFHLTQNGVSAWLDAKDLKPGVDWETDLDGALAFVLVVTRESLRSANVRREWQRALDKGKRIIAVVFRGRSFPAELSSVERVDFRGAFPPALKRLTTRLVENASNVNGIPYVMDECRPLSRFPRWPPWVATIALMLFVLILFPLLLANYKDTSTSGAYRVFLYALGTPLLLGFCVWHLSVAFLRRRMGLTRLIFASPFSSMRSGTLCSNTSLVAQSRSYFQRRRWDSSGDIPRL